MTFEVVFKGAVPCRDEDQVFTGTLDVVADGKVVARKRVQITVPACPQRLKPKLEPRGDQSEAAELITRELAPGSVDVRLRGVRFGYPSAERVSLASLEEVVNTSIAAVRA